MIKPVTSDMFETVLNIFKSATLRMLDQDIRQWDEIYPSGDILKEDIITGSMYGYFENDRLCAVATLNSFQSPEYSEVDWKYKDASPLVLHRLCVNPEFQNRGIAKELILFAEDFAASRNYRTIRFDAYKENPGSTGLYLKMGYSVSGTVVFRKGEFYCFEKKTGHYQPEVTM